MTLIDTDTEATLRILRYDDHADTVVDLHEPAGSRSGTTVVLVHGGFWREGYRRDLMAPLVPSLLADGHVVANVEYRRVGGDGGWPTTLSDAASAIDVLADDPAVEGTQVVTVGHSAGGHLAVWLAARHRLPAGAPGADPRVRPVAAVSQAGVVAWRDGGSELGEGAARDLVGGPGHPLREGLADPSALLPLGVPVTLVHAVPDEDVPYAQSLAWARRAGEAGDRVELHAVPGDHYVHTDPASTAWRVVLEVLARRSWQDGTAVRSGS